MQTCYVSTVFAHPEVVVVISSKKYREMLSDVFQKKWSVLCG